MDKTLRIGVIGIGGMGNHHINSYQDIPNVEIVALCDIVPEKAQKAKQNYHLDCPVETDYNQLLKMENLDAVDINTPNYLHAPIAIAALQAGKHVFCEKPDCITVEQALQMKEAAEQSGKVLMVMRNNRYYEGSTYVKKMIDEGKFGNIYAGRCGWIRRRGIPGKGGWFTPKEQSGGGPLIDLGVHMIDLAIWLMGNPTPVAVSGCTFTKFANDTSKSDSIHASFGEAKEGGTFDVEDLAMGFIRFDNGACLQIEFSWASNIPKELKFVELRGEKAGCQIHDSNDVTISMEDETGRQVDLMPKMSDLNGHGENLKHFVDVVLNGAKPDFVPQQGVHMIQILNAIYESAKTGKEVQL